MASLQRQASAAPLISYKAASPGVDFAAGVVAGAAGLIVGQPFDVVKVRYQSPQFNGKYGNTFGAIGAIMREEGTKGLFKGVMSPMAGIAFINGVVFTSYSFFMKLQVHSHASTEPTLAQITLAGAGSGVLGSLIACPTELIKIRQQSAPPHLYPSTLSVFTDILRQGGVRGLYRGFSATAMRDVAYGPYFCTYEAVCRFFKSRKPQPQAGFGGSMSPEPNPSRQSQHSHANLIEEAEQELSVLTWPELMTAGGLAGVIAWMATFPLDVLKTRMQAAQWTPSSGNTVIQGGGAVLTATRAPTLRYIATEAIRREGWRVMFAGLGPTLIRAVPANMVIFLTFEGIVTQLK